MTDFRTSIPKANFPFSIQHQDQTLCMGSCFAAHMGQRLHNLAFPILLNPFGILYNPISIAQSIEQLINNATYTKADLFQHQELWHSFDHHSQFSGLDRADVLMRINQTLQEARVFLQKTNRVILTLGTAYTFVKTTDNKVVANCHKLPASNFERVLLPIDNCVSALSQMFESLKATCPSLEVVLSVSPIRHIRDGLIQNQRSKATLLLAAAELERQFEFVHYFPAYEIVMDDLRDYRFYESDYLHPNQQAVDYIWSYFQDALFEKKTQALTTELSKLRTAAQHRAFHAASTQHQDFLRQQLAKIDQLKKQHKFLKLDELEGKFLIQLN